MSQFADEPHTVFAQKNSGHGQAETPYEIAQPIVGHQISDTQLTFADGQTHTDTHSCRAEDHCLLVTQTTGVPEIVQLWRQRQDLHKAEKSLTLQIKAKCRALTEGDKTEANKVYKSMMNGCDHEFAPAALAAATPFLKARAVIEADRKAIEKRLTKMAKDLPIAEFITETPGLSWGIAYSITGEAGDLSNYDNPAKLWKRFGLAVMPDGTRQRKVAGLEAVEHGYSPKRRSVAWQIGECIVKAGKGHYREMYEKRKEYETTRVETKGHAHNRATRYVTKRVLRDLWLEWNGHQWHEHQAGHAATRPLEADPILSPLPPMPTD